MAIECDRVICAIPLGDDDLAKEAGRYAEVVLGPEDDVLYRYYLANQCAEADYVMRITGDCPLISPALCAEVLRRCIKREAEYASNIEPRTFPKGLDCEVFTRDLLNRAHANASPHEREHVTTWMRDPNRDVKRINIASPWTMDGRLTLDTEDDYKVICAAFGHAPYQRV